MPNAFRQPYSAEICLSSMEIRAAYRWAPHLAEPETNSGGDERPPGTPERPWRADREDGDQAQEGQQAEIHRHCYGDQEDDREEDDPQRCGERDARPQEPEGPDLESER